MDKEVKIVYNDADRFGYYKLHPHAVPPTKATKFSACYDVRFQLPVDTDTVTIFDNNVGLSIERAIEKSSKGEAYIRIPAGHRAILNTALILLFPPWMHVKMYIRSGLAAKQGLILSNGVGIIDADYTDELKVIMTNTNKSDRIVWIGDRIAQIEYCINTTVLKMEELDSKPQPISERLGGLGSTGK